MKATGIIVLILVIFAAAVLAEVWRELHCFKITRYRIRTSKIKGDAGKVRIAFLIMSMEKRMRSCFWRSGKQSRI